MGSRRLRWRSVVRVARQGSSQVLVDANHGAVGGGVDLNEIAQLVSQPETAVGPGVKGGRQTANERRGDVALVRYLADQRPAVAPRAKFALAAPVPEAVGGDLIDRQHYRFGRLVVQSGPPGVLGNKRPQAAKFPCLEGYAGHVGRPGRHRAGKRAGEVDGLEGAASLPVFAPCDIGVGPVSLIDNVGGQRFQVVGTQQPEWSGSVEGDVQEGLMKLAFGEFGRGTLG